MKYRFFILCLLLTAQNYYCITIDRVILSTDTNNMYYEFWPLVANAWKNKIGFKPTLALIAPKDFVLDESIGDVIRFEPIENIPTSFQAQVIRLLLPAYFENETSIIADIDMLPINKNYFTDLVANIDSNKFVIYNDGHYKKHNYNDIYPMCYIAAKGSIFKDVFKIKCISQIPEIIKEWYANSINHWKGFGWNTDELMLFKYTTEWNKITNNLITLGLDISSQRIDRLNWNYSLDLVKNRHYIDAHLLRPYLTYKNQTDKLIVDIEGEKS